MAVESNAWCAGPSAGEGWMVRKPLKPQSQISSMITDIFAPATAIGLEKLSANGLFFVGAQKAVGLYQTTHMVMLS